MFYLVLQLILMLFIILLASQLFTNALEYFGHRVGFSAGVTGSIFAAVATALPETSVPVVALLAGSSNRMVNEDISVGAILGAPLMLSTLSTMLMGFFALKRRGIGGWIKPEKAGFVRDLDFFILAFLSATLAMYLPVEPFYWRALVSLFLISIYIFYLKQTFKASKKLVAEGHGVIPDEPLMLSKLGCKSNKTTIALQLLLGLGLLVAGTKGFIEGVEAVSKILKVSTLLISLLIIPVATELPEKVNSILWIRKNKDTLAFGNISGAMVFQGTLLPALGVVLTAWQPNLEVLMGMLITLGAAFWLRVNISAKGIRISALFINGLLYALYLYLTLG